jgi:hypothetical protein
MAKDVGLLAGALGPKGKARAVKPPPKGAVNVTRGPAAAKEMAQMEKAFAKTARGKK